MKEHVTFESLFGIGDPVKISINGVEIKGWIRTVFFTNGKVRYSVKIELTGKRAGRHTTFHNIDSVFIIPDNSGKKVEWELDNYS